MSKTLLDIRISDILVPEGRARELDMVWVEALAQIIDAQGLTNPITVREVEGKPVLVSGHHRLAAVKHLGHETILARLSSATSDDQARLEEVMENLARNELNALDRCHHLYDLKQVYERIYPETKHGGNRKNNELDSKLQNLQLEPESEIFSFGQDAATKTGLSYRSIAAAVAIWKGLSVASRDGLRAREPVMVIDRTAASQSLKTYELRKADHVASQQATVKYLNPRRKAVVGQSVTSADDLGVMTASGDIVKIDVRVENEIQAKRVAKSRLDKKNAQKMTGRLTFVGTPVLVAGAVVELAGFGVFNGRYLITQSEHKMERSGYETSIDIEYATDKNIKDGKSAKTMKKGDAIDDLGIIDSDGVLSREEKQ